MPLVDLGIKLTAGTPGTTATAGTPGTPGQVDAGNAAGSSAGNAADLVTTSLSKVAWAMQLNEAILLNERRSAGPGAWVTYKVAYLFADGNAVLVKEPDCVAYTGPLFVARNLRRAGEVYVDE